MPGYFITLEGPDGSGKTTQARLLAERLRAAGRSPQLTREPGGTALGGIMRAALLHPEATLSALAQAELVPANKPAEPMLPLTEALLLSADRAQHVARIREWLAADMVVISDRYADATLAYQGYGRGYDLARLRALQAMATGGLAPDLTLLLDLPVDEGQRRKRAGHEDGEEINRLDLEQRDFQERVRAGYLALAAAEPQRWITLDAREQAGALAEQVWAEVTARLGL
ncbi:MAG TPA: dTMP kinase [Ktedonobacterales bacterium]|jgi:dTMP kinase|nr:dTMP kinase [Ktedonobacterales bacterium]